MITRVKTSVTPLGIGGAFEHDPTTSSANVFGYKAGAVNIAGTRTAIAAGTVNVSGTSYIYVDYTSTPVIVSSTTPPSSLTSIWLYTWTGIDEFQDLRSWLTSSLEPVA